MKTVTITISGRPASKKNNRRNYGHVSLPSKAFEAFRESALWQLKKYRVKFTGKVSADYYFVQKGKMHQDVDNAIASINDVLQDAGIIADDDLIVCGTFSKVGGADDWATTIRLQEAL